jgi:hypothetical protein
MTGRFVPTVVGWWFWEDDLTGEVEAGIGTMGSG